MHKVSGPTLYIVRFYWTKRKRTQTESFILLLDRTPSTFTTFWLTVLEPWAWPQVTFAVLHRLWQLWFFTTSAYRSCVGVPRLRLGWPPQASTRCSGPEVIMWAASRHRLEDTLDVHRQKDETPATVVCYSGGLLKVIGLWQVSRKAVLLSHLMSRKRCPHTLWQTGGLTPERRWSSWDGCSDRQKNFFEVTPEIKRKIKLRNLVV